jgi:hypothetical protein
MAYIGKYLACILYLPYLSHFPTLSPEIQLSVNREQRHAFPVQISDPEKEKGRGWENRNQTKNDHWRMIGWMIGKREHILFLIPSGCDGCYFSYLMLR